MEAEAEVDAEVTLRKGRGGSRIRLGLITRRREAMAELSDLECNRVAQHNNTTATAVSRYNRVALMSTCYVEDSPPEIPATSIPSESTPPESPTLTKHADLWFCDGSVILQAESTLFRVHKSQLSRRSTVFSDMFTLAQPPVMSTHATLADETYEGCPVVKLYDSAEDVANLLLALYDGPFVPGLLFHSSRYINTSTDRTCIRIGSSAIMTLMILPLSPASFDYPRNM